MKPKILTRKSAAIFEKIISRIPVGKSSVKIGNDGDAFMHLHVERLTSYDVGTLYSLAHYFEQNGDLCQDPEMLFLRTRDGAVVPCMFQQAIPPVYQESLFFDGGWRLRPAMQRDHTSFAAMWLRNIEYQQNL